MNFIRLLPVLLCIILLGAHFLRAGYMALVIIVISSPLVLLVRQPWAPRIMQVILVAGGIEWIRTMINLVIMRQSMGMPWVRLALILGTVSLLTVVSAYIFRLKALRERYNLGQCFCSGRSCQ